jgi:hypothetical protein
MDLDKEVGNLEIIQVRDLGFSLTVNSASGARFQD